MHSKGVQAHGFVQSMGRWALQGCKDPTTPPMRGKRNRVIGYESVAYHRYNIIISGALPWALPRTATIASTMPTVHLLDYVAGNVRSLVNAIEKVGYTVEWVRSPTDVPFAEVNCPPCALRPLFTYAPVDKR